MLKYLIASLALAVVALGAAPKAEAIPIVWGTSEHFDTIAKLKIPENLKSDVPPEWLQGEGAELTRHSESFTLFWIAGLSLSDKGYAVHVPGVDKYWDVTEDELKAMQEEGVVPTPLPSTGIAPMTYVVSFLGYGVILVIVLLAIAAQSRKSAAPPPPPATA